MNTPDARTPVLVGSGQITRREPDDREPTDVLADAVALAAEDSGGQVLPTLESIRVVSLLSWRYRDPARLVAARLGIDPAETAYSTMGGNTPQMLINRTAVEIAAGDLDAAVVGGVELWRTRMSMRRNDQRPAWTTQGEDVAPTRTFGGDLDMSDPQSEAVGAVMPIQLYPMMEVALRHDLGRTPDDHLTQMTRLWSRFSTVASTNPHAWNQRSYSPEELATVGPENRMVGSPYPKLLNSNNMVEQAAAVIMMSYETARSVGVPPDRMIFLHAGTDGADPLQITRRERFDTSTAMRIAGRRALDLAGIGPADLRHVDLYSCFPSAVQIAARELGLAETRDLTVTGGLTFAGGPWNNYVTHAVATMVDRLRDQPGFGLCTANGGYLTKHAFGVYSSEPPARGFRHLAPQEEIDRQPTVAPAGDVDGTMTLEAYTVMHDRDSNPETGIAVMRTADGQRAWGTTTDADALRGLLETDAVERTVQRSLGGTFTLA
jgi:acetyl-CoA C-acetyltransferase